MAEDENRFEKENRAFYNRVLAAYMAIAKRVPQRVVPVDATDAIAKVTEKELCAWWRNTCSPICIL